MQRMHLTNLGLALAVALGCAGASGCGSDTDPVPPHVTGGSLPTGGAGGDGGAETTGGSGGVAGTGGTAGGGAVAGGSGGVGGSGGLGGSGGSPTGPTRYVAKTGNDSNAGTSLSAPLLTIQKCLDVVQPGETCAVRAGTYGEALVLMRTASNTSRITLKNYNGETVTVSSGSSRALRSGGLRHGYTVDGLGFTSTHTSYDQWGTDYTIDFGDGVWNSTNPDDPNSGNKENIIKNCYIEGGIRFYGHYNIVENNELYGRNQWKNGIYDSRGASHNNTFRDNVVHGYSNRGIWTMEKTDGTLIEGNTVYDIGVGTTDTPQGIDCDGATVPVTNCVVRNNHVYNVAGHCIQQESGFGGVIEGNIVHDCTRRGIIWINYGQGPDWYAANGAEWRTQNTNGITRNNVVYATNEAGIMFAASPGHKVYNNTVYGNTAPDGYYGGIVLDTYGGYCPFNIDVRNNIMSNNELFAFWLNNSCSSAGGIQLNYNFYYHPTKSKTHYYAGTQYTVSEIRAAKGQEANSLFADPLFVNATSGDFHLQSSSQARGAGVTLPEVTVDRDGNARVGAPSIGAYE